ncbi:uncharacterized protein LOC128276373, partial [Anopheles cruzii]|uniref:uncharacterized protein LOC128276373 n=1 Tax=Anopheles cruzii TaxID=68878 RepID=UPI0022EC9927
FSVAYAKLNICYAVLFNIVPLAYNYPQHVLHYYGVNSSTKRTVEFILPLVQNFHGLDIRHNILHYTLYSLCIIPACVSTTIMLWFKGMLFILIRYNTLLYQLVNGLLREYAQKSSTASVGAFGGQRHLVDIIELHLTAIQCTSLLDSILRLILLVQSLGCLLLWGLLLYYITRNPNLNLVNVMVLMFSIVIEMWCFSYLGHRLTEENAMISHTAYSTYNWYNEPRSVQQFLQRIILQSSNRKATITAGKFYNVNIVSFAQ